MRPIEIVEEREEYRLVRCGESYSVLECRGDKVMSCHCNNRREAFDNLAGMEAVIGHDGWMTEEQARRGFRAMADEECHWAEVMW